MILHSVSIGGGRACSHMIITGPNAGGKSTVLKATAVSLVLAQSLGIAPAAAATITPFHTIQTYIDISDDIVEGASYFKKEVIRTHQLVSRVKKTARPRGRLAFIAYDEIFKGTAPNEGAAGAYSILKEMASDSNALTMTATHFDLLTSLDSASSAFKNYHVSAHVAPDGSIEYPFVLEPGILTQNIAFDILAREGFDSSIIATARSVLHSHFQLLR